MKPVRKSTVGIGFRNGIGNFVMMTPLLRVIKEQIQAPDLLIDDEWQDSGREAIELLANKSNCVNSVVRYKGQELKYKYLYMPYHSACADKLYQAINGLTYDTIKRIPVWGDNLVHEILYYVLEAKDRIPIQPRIVAQEVGSIFSHNPYIAKRYIVLSNGYLKSDDNVWIKKGFTNWEKLIPILGKYFPRDTLAMIGDKSDLEWSTPLYEQFKRDFNLENLCGKYSIYQTSTIIKHARAIVSTDTGVFHIADAHRVPGVVLFGPTLISKNGPWNGTIIPVRSTKACAPCQGTTKWVECDGGCMNDITIGSIMAALRKTIPYT